MASPAKRFRVGAMMSGADGAATVTVKESNALRPPPSRTEIVMVAAPVCPVAGVIVMVRLSAPPPRAIPAGGIRVEFEEFADTVKDEAEVWASETMNGIGPEFPFGGMDWFPI